MQCVLGDGQRLQFWSDHWINGRCVKQIAPAVLYFVKPSAMQRLVVDALPAAAWIRDIKGSPSVPALAEILLLWNTLSGMELEAHPDRFRWRLSSDGKFSARSTYDCFFFGREHFPCADELWGSWAPLEIKIFVWLALHNRLWTADRLARRNLQHPPQCPLCCQEEETANHMLLQCSYSR